MNDFDPAIPIKDPTTVRYCLRVLVNGQPAVLNTSTGLCFSAEQIPQGPPMVVVTQPRVTGM